MLRLRWFDIDPNKPFTGSFNPIYEDPKQFYHETDYRQTFVGLHPDVLMLVNHITKGMPRDLRYLLIHKYIIPANYLEVLKRNGFLPSLVDGKEVSLKL